jgi:uncharacterized membrane protein
MRRTRLLILLLILLALLQAVHYWPLLPDPMATHFDDAGKADGWSSKSSFFASNLIFTIGMALLFLALPLLLDKVPNEWINMPNKGYWLAPERRAATIEAIQRWSEWLGAATVALLLGMAQLTIAANLSGGNTLGQGFWVLFGAYVAFMLAWLVGFVRWAYQKPPETRVGA